MIPQYSTAHRVLCIISHNQANKHISIPRTWYCLSMDQVKRCNGLYLLNEHSDYVLFPIILVHKARYSMKQIMTLKGMTQGNYISNCSIHLRLTTHQVFFQLQQNVQWTNEMSRMISASTGINGVSLAHTIVIRL